MFVYFPLIKQHIIYMGIDEKRQDDALDPSPKIDTPMGFQGHVITQYLYSYTTLRNSLIDRNLFKKFDQIICVS